MATIDPSQAYLPELRGTSLSIFAVSVVGGVLSAITVLLRTWVRVSQSTFGLDDGLMLGGLVCDPPSCLRQVNQQPSWRPSVNTPSLY